MPSGLQNRKDPFNSLFYGLWIIYMQRGRGRMAGRIFYRAAQIVKTIIRARRTADYLYFEQRFERLKIDPYAFFLCFIHDVDAYDRCSGDFEYLEYEVKVPFEHRRVAYHNHRVRVFKAYKIPCDLLLLRVRHERVCSWQINDCVFVFFNA